jgi:hypothetical protein
MHKQDSNIKVSTGALTLFFDQFIFWLNDVKIMYVMIGKQKCNKCNILKLSEAMGGTGAPLWEARELPEGAPHGSPPWGAPVPPIASHLFYYILIVRRLLLFILYHLETISTIIRHLQYIYIYIYMYIYIYI